MYNNNVWIFSLCKNFDERFKSVSEDYGPYMFSETQAPVGASDKEPFNRYADSGDLLGFVQSASVASVNRCVNRC